MFTATMIDRRDVARRERSVLCRFEDGEERFVPRNQCPSDQYWPEDAGEVFELEVAQWMVEQWESTPVEEPVKLAGVVALRETAKALQVRLADGQEEWVAKSGIAKGSPVAGDGDRGELWVLRWLAEKKGWPAGGAAPASQRGGDRARPNIGQDARGGYEPGHPGLDEDDTIPF
jgi:hypothetical protein